MAANIAAKLHTERMSNILFLSTLISMLFLRQRGLEFTFLRVWIPIYLCMPTAFTSHIPMVPVRTFLQAAILPLLFVLWRDHLKQHLRLGRMEMLLIAYVLVRAVCDYLGRGYKDAQNYTFYMLSALLGPYLLGRYLITSRRMDIATARMFVVMFLLFFPLFLYEAKFWVSPIFKIFSVFFPDAGSGLSIRWGLARTAGTFEHPILAAIMIIAVYRLHRWLCWIGFWEQTQTGVLAYLQAKTRWVPFLSFKYQVSVVLILMALLTISRGPWIGGLVGAGMAMVGNVKDRKKWLWVFAIVLLIGGLGGKLALDAYITPKVGEALSGEAQTMLYRQEMVERYKAFLMEKMWTGWGLTTVPKIQGMESVDNAFFLMALQHGVLAPTIFLTILLYAILSQVKHGLSAPASQSPIGFSFAGIYLMCLVSFATVYMGAQTEPLIFLLLGWGESIKRRQGEDAPVGAEGSPAAPVKPEFRRVMV